MRREGRPSTPAGDPPPRSATLVRMGVALGVIALSAGLVLWRWSGPAPRVTGDTWWYAHIAMTYSGIPASDADSRASLLICVERHRNDPKAGSNPACNKYKAITTPRYARIFTTRPLYSLMTAPLVSWLGITVALMVITMACCIAGGCLLYAAVRRSGANRIAGFIAVLLLFILPSGFWMSRLNAEAPMVVGLLASVLGLLLWRTGRSIGLAVAAIALLWTFLAKPANGVALTIGFIAAAGLAAMLEAKKDRNRDLAVVGLGVIGGLGWIAASEVLQLPGLSDTIQDTATLHFVKPDIPNPWRFLLSKDLSLIKGEGMPVLKQVWPWLLTLVGVGVLLMRMRWKSYSWLAVGVTGIAAVLAHPLRSEYPRLSIPVWLPVVAGLSLLLTALLDRNRATGEVDLPSND